MSINVLRRPSLLIRELLLQYGEISPSDVYSVVRRFKTKASYMSILKLFKYAEKLGLIRKSKEKIIKRYRKGKKVITFKRVYYKLVEGKEGDPAWNNIFGTLYPNARLGLKYYAGRTVYILYVNGKVFGKYIDYDKAEKLADKLKTVGITDVQIVSSTI
jgi:predicted AAA+ superfamily ATPase